MWPPGVLGGQVQAPQPLGKFKTESLEFSDDAVGHLIFLSVKTPEVLIPQGFQELTRKLKSHSYPQLVLWGQSQGARQTQARPWLPRGEKAAEGQR